MFLAVTFSKRLGVAGKPHRFTVHFPIAPTRICLNRLNALSGWRKSAAQKMEVESDVVLPKPWMHAIAEQNPQSLEELSALMPQSPWRLENFGAQILKALHEK